MKKVQIETDGHGYNIDAEEQKILFRIFEEGLYAAIEFYYDKLDVNKLIFSLDKDPDGWVEAYLRADDREWWRLVKREIPQAIKKNGDILIRNEFVNNERFRKMMDQLVLDYYPCVGQYCVIQQVDHYVSADVNTLIDEGYEWVRQIGSDIIYTIRKTR